MQQPIDILFLTLMDWANSGNNYVKCLRSLGLKVIAYKGELHPFMYPEQIPIHPDLAKVAEEYNRKLIVVCDSKNLRELIHYSKVIHFKDTQLIDCGYDLRKKIVIAQHGGKTYRNQHETYSTLWNQIAVNNIIHCPDLLGLGLNKEQWILYPVDTDVIRPVVTNNPMYLVGHYPSNAENKGTKEIVEVIDDLLKTRTKYKWAYMGVKENQGFTQWYTVLDLIGQCDIFVEALKPMIHERVYGTWGNQCLEAAALGKIVVTHSLHEEIYKKEYGDHPLFIANTQEELHKTLFELLSWNLPKIREHQRKTRAWAVQKHSIKPTAKRLWEKVYKDLFPEHDIRRQYEDHESDKQTICQTLRDIRELVHDSGSIDKIDAKLDIAMDMAKSMNDKLFDYKHDWDKDENIGTRPAL